MIERNTYENFYIDFLKTEIWPFVDKFMILTNQVSSDNEYFFAGNGASAAIASHLANDFSKTLNVRGNTFHDPAVITCLANDYGYDMWIAEAIKIHSKKNDNLILISSSGRSKNIINAAKIAKSIGLKIIVLCGPRPSNDLIETADLHLKVKNNSYNVIECCHMMTLCAVVDSKNYLEVQNK